MKRKMYVALFLLGMVCGLQLLSSPYAVKIEKVMVERQTDQVSDKNVIH